jgi:hypothetical protein
MIPMVIEDVIKAIEIHIDEVASQDTTDITERVRHWLHEGKKHMLEAMEKLQIGLDMYDEERDLD